MLQESQRQLIRESEFTVVVFGKGENFVLLRCNGDDYDYQYDLLKARDAGERGMRFCGVFALAQNGQLKADLDPGNIGAVYTMAHAGLGFMHLVADRMKRKQTDDFVRFAEGLHGLDDPRSDA